AAAIEHGQADGETDSPLQPDEIEWAEQVRHKRVVIEKRKEHRQARRIDQRSLRVLGRQREETRDRQHDTRMGHDGEDLRERTVGAQEGGENREQYPREHKAADAERHQWDRKGKVRGGRYKGLEGSHSW